MSLRFLNYLPSNTCLLYTSAKRREKKAGKEAETLEKETEKDVRMEEREITSVEDVEEILTPTEPTRTTEETKLDNIMRIVMEQFGQLKEDNKQMEENSKKTRKEDKEELDKKFELSLIHICVKYSLTVV